MLMVVVPTVMLAMTSLAPVRLQYEMPPNDDACPDAFSAQVAIADLLGNDPFEPRAKRTALLRVVNVDNTQQRLMLELRDEQGQLVGARELNSGEGCRTLVETGALALAVALDPMAAMGKAPPRIAKAPPPPVVFEAPSEQAPPSSWAPWIDLVMGKAPPQNAPPVQDVPDATVLTMDAVKPPSMVSWQLGLGTQLAAFPLPELTRGGDVFVRLRGDAWSVSLHTRTELPTWSLYAQTTLQAVPCVHVPVSGRLAPARWLPLEPTSSVQLNLCGSALIASQWYMLPISTAALYAGAGGRVGVEWLLFDRSATEVFVGLDGIGYFDPYSFVVGLPAVPVQATVGLTLAWSVWGD